MSRMASNVQLARPRRQPGAAVALVAVGWGITIAPELTPIGPGQAVTHVPLTDVDARRHSVLVVRDGEHESPEIATVVAAVQRVSARRGG